MFLDEMILTLPGRDLCNLLLVIDTRRMKTLEENIEYTCSAMTISSENHMEELIV